MKIVKSLNISETDYLSKTTKNYINGTAKNNVFFKQPSLDLILKNSLTREFEISKRPTLVNSLLNQYKNDNIRLDIKSEVYKNILSLKENNIFTCTTGQQIHIFLGPLFFIYKIKSLLKIVKLINSQKHKNKVVPIFWMASEDHDFEEISKTKLFGNEYKWEIISGNAVGRLNCKGLHDLISELESRADKTEENKALFLLLKKHYYEKNTLSAATRGILHDIFEKEGLIIINPDDKALKEMAINVFREELENNLIYKTANEQSTTLKKNGYKPVLNPQKSNFFWLDNEKRYKLIESENKNFEYHKGMKISKEEILKNVEKLSPNVFARVLYQESILPNLVYVGGSTEIEYCLLLTKTFEKFKMKFPVLILRDSAIILKEKIYNDIKKLGIYPEDLFLNSEKLINKVNSKQSSIKGKVDVKLNKLEKLLAEINDEMISSEYEKHKVELYIKEFNSTLNKLKNYKSKIDLAVLVENPISEKVLKLKSKFFTSIQERTDFLIEYPDLYSCNFIFEGLESRFYFLSK
ncbi:MAG: bacillithiol biosynthesis cysteine-adding enzyme BshC [Bacteroidia bacterium]|nr:bacillithiol biosynthesis cysteine-adding enzyme BshC [Bacteroidia bacterium]